MNIIIQLLIAFLIIAYAYNTFSLLLNSRSITAHSYLFQHIYTKIYMQLPKDKVQYAHITAYILVIIQLLMASSFLYIAYSVMTYAMWKVILVLACVIYRILSAGYIMHILNQLLDMVNHNEDINALTAKVDKSSIDAIHLFFTILHFIVYVNAGLAIFF